MNVQLTLANYRCFSRSRPVTFRIGRGFTAFVGANSSGKSSLLRLFYELRSLFVEAQERSTLYKALKGDRQSFSIAGVSNPNDIFSRDNDGDLVLRFVPTRSEKLHPDWLELVVPHGTTSFVARVSVRGKVSEPSAITSPWTETSQISLRDSPIVDISPFLHAFRVFANSFYVGPFRNALSVPGSDSYYDISVGQSFVKKWNEFKNGNDANHRARIVAVSDMVQNIFRLTRLEVNASADNNGLIVVLSNGRSFRLDETGSGLTQFLLVLGAAAIRQPDLILIDEPELNLHPTLQLSFLTNLARFASTGVMFSTHNIGLARSAGEDVYVLRREPDEPPQMFALGEAPRLSEVLGELSFGGYQELGFNKVVLVEGVNEIKTVQQWLRLFRKDHKILVLQLGGSNMINGSRHSELAELTRITPRLYALIDSERAEEGAHIERSRQDFARVCRDLNIQCHVLQRRATENYFPSTAVSKALGAEVAALQPYEALNSRWPKSVNWRIAAEMTRDELMDTDLGRFLNSI